MENKFEKNIRNKNFKPIAKGSTFNVYKDEEGNIYKEFCPNICGINLNDYSSSDFIKDIIKDYKCSFESAFTKPKELFDAYKNANLTSLIKEPKKIGDWLIYEYVGGEIFDYKYSQGVFDCDNKKNVINLLKFIKSLVENVLKFHNCNIAVLDISPSNILNVYIDTQDDIFARIIDFGSARSIDEIKLAIMEDNISSAFISTQKYYDRTRLFNVINNYKKNPDGNYLKKELFRLDAIAILKILIYAIGNKLHEENEYSDEEELYSILYDIFINKLKPNKNNEYNSSFFKYYYCYYLFSKMIWYVFENKFDGVEGINTIIDEILSIIDEKAVDDNHNQKVIKMYSIISSKKDIVFKMLEQYNNDTLIAFIKDDYRYYRPKKPFDLYYYILFGNDEDSDYFNYNLNSYIDNRLFPNIECDIFESIYDDLDIEYEDMHHPIKIHSFYVPNIPIDYDDSSYYYLLMKNVIKGENSFIIGDAGLGKSTILLMLEAILLRGGKTTKTIQCNRLDYTNIDENFIEGYDYYFIDGIDELLIDKNKFYDCVKKLTGTIICSSREQDKYLKEYLKSREYKLIPFAKNDIKRILNDYYDLSFNERNIKVLKNILMLKIYLKYNDKIYDCFYDINEVSLLNIFFVETYKQRNKGFIYQNMELNKKNHDEIFDSLVGLGGELYKSVFLKEKVFLSIPQYFDRIFSRYNHRIIGVHKVYENYAISFYLFSKLLNYDNYDEKDMLDFLNTIIKIVWYGDYKDSLFYLGQLLFKNNNTNLKIFMSKIRDVINKCEKIDSKEEWPKEMIELFGFIIHNSEENSDLELTKIINKTLYNSLLLTIYLGYSDGILDDNIWSEQNFLEQIDSIPFFPFYNKYHFNAYLRGVKIFEKNDYIVKYFHLLNYNDIDILEINNDFYKTYDGNVYDYSLNKLLIARYPDKINPKTTVISEGAFLYHLYNINFLHIPYNIIALGAISPSYNSGSNCFKEIVFENGSYIKELTCNQFSNCEIEEMVIPDGVEIIGDEAFSECFNLKRVVLPKNLKKLGKRVFYGCDNLLEIEYNNNVDSWNEKWTKQLLRDNYQDPYASIDRIICNDEIIYL